MPKALLLTGLLAIVGSLPLFAEEPISALPIVSLTPKGAAIPMRPLLFGQNMNGLDWHGTEKRSPFFWSDSRHQPDPAWKSLTHSFPVRLMRFHTGNNYEWLRMVGPVESRTGGIREEFSKQTYRVDPGLDEFLRWVKSLPGSPEISLIASPLRPVAELADLVAYCNATSGPMAELRTRNGHPAPYHVHYWEMGNEMDWRGRADQDLSKPDKFQSELGRVQAEDYIALLKPRIAAMRAVDPSIEVYAHAKTAPFPNQNPDWQQWHRQVIAALGGQIDGIILHPYYDGYPVPLCLKSVDALAADIQASPHPHLKIWVNEHARWPNLKAKDFSLWQESWNLQGALSTGDFLIGLIARPQVAMANYWCYGHRGPWRVLDSGEIDGRTVRYGTPIHGLYTLINRTALSNAQPLTVQEPAGMTHPKNYAYNVSAIAFSDNKGQHSLLAVNRSSHQAFTISWPSTGKPIPVTQLRLTGDNLQATNTAAAPTNVVCRESSVTPVLVNGHWQFTLPPHSIVGWLWNESSIQ